MNRLIAGLFLIGFSAGAQAALFGRAPATPGGTDYRAYYDTTLDVTWLANANYARTTGYDADGAMSWEQSRSWIAHLNRANHLGTNTWRLPMAGPINGSSYLLTQLYTGSSDRGWNITAPGTMYAASVTNEMAHLYHVTLNKVSYYDTAGNVRPEYESTVRFPFINVRGTYYFWSGSLATASQPIAFTFEHGGQDLGNLTAPGYAWPVASGDPLYSATPRALPAGLRGRMAAQPGKTDYQAYYDVAQDITWVRDATLADTRHFGVSGISGGAWAGRMTWDLAQEWIAALNAANYLGKSDWRLPAIRDTDDPGCASDYSMGGSDCGYNVDVTTSEVAHLFHVTLGNAAAFDVEGNYNPCGYTGPDYCLGNTGPFWWFVPNAYWSGTEYAPDPVDAWLFHARDGLQHNVGKDEEWQVWAVRDGDINPLEDGDEDGVPDDLDNCPSLASGDQSDNDEDGRGDICDNCTLVANVGQYDADQDGFGNFCDADLNNSGSTTATDYAILRSVMGHSAAWSPTAASADLNGSGSVSAADFAILRSMIGEAPGPSALVP